jgi:hypothetical protein
MIIGLILALIPTITMAADLRSPFSTPSAKLLPKGVRNFSYKGVYASATDRYSNAGTTVTVGDALNQSITFQKAIDSKREAWEKAALEQTMLDMGKSPNDSFGNTTGEVKVSATAHVPVFAIGLTNKLTMAVVVPVVESSVHVDHGVVQTNEALHKEMVNKLSGKGVPSSVAELDSKMFNPIGIKSKEYGYADPQNEEKTKLGDVRLVSKYGLIENSGHILASTFDLTLPTGQDADVNDLVDVPSGDEQFDVGVGLAHDYSLSDNITLSSSANYTWQLADNSSKRIPEVSYSKATPDVDTNVRRDLGDIAAAQLGATWSSKGYNLGAGYAFQYKNADQFSGDAYSSERYGWMSQDTVQRMHSLQLIGGFDTIYLFRKKAFPAPLKILFTHARVLEGKNVVKDPMYALDFNLFF